MASLARPSLLPQCSSCIRRVTRLGLEHWGLHQQTRNISKAEKDAKSNIIVKLLADVPQFGRAGSYVPVNPSHMRNRWFPWRVADYVSLMQLKQLKAQEVNMTRDLDFGVKVPLKETDSDDIPPPQQKQYYVRPFEVELLSAERSMSLIDTFLPSTIDFSRQVIEQDQSESKQQGASSAADIMNAAMMASKPKPLKDAIYGSVSIADVIATIKSALAHNDEAARVILNENDVSFVTGHDKDDASKVKQLGVFKVEIRVPGAEKALTRTIRVRAKE